MHSLQQRWICCALQPRLSKRLPTWLQTKEKPGPPVGGPDFVLVRLAGFLPCEEVVVEDVFQIFLASAFAGGLAAGGGGGGDFFERGLLAEDFFAEGAFPGGVAFVDEGVEGFVFNEAVGDDEAAGEGVHAADVGVEEVEGVEGAATALGVEVEAAAAEAAVLEDDEHGLGGGVDVHGELVGVPAEEGVARVGVNAAELAVRGGDGELVLKGVAGEGGVIGFDVELEVFVEAVGFEEADDGGAVEVVLVLGGFLGLGLDEELAFEADLFLVFDGEAQEGCELLLFLLEACVEEGFVAFAAAPEDVVFTVEVVGGVEGVLDLGGGVGEDLEVGVGAGAVGVAGVAEEVCGAPEELDAGFVLFLFGELDEGAEVFRGFGEGGAFGGDVAVVETVVVHTEFLDEFEVGIEGVLGGFDGGSGVPFADPGGGAEHVNAGGLVGVPVGDGEPEVVLHGFAADDALCVIPFIGERVFALRAFVGDGCFDFWEVTFGHGCVVGW